MVDDGILEGRYAGDCTLPPPREFKVLDWNIERGLRLAGVIEVMEREQPYLCILQEVDLNAKRTRRRHVADVLAARFQFNYVFGIEFEELCQGSGAEPAFHGQAILARGEILAPRVLRFSQQSDAWSPRWYVPRWGMFQRRHGGRMALVAELSLGERRLVVYDLHLESRGDDDLRLWQLSEVVSDSFRYPPGTPLVVAGDFNTRITPSPLREYLLMAGFRDTCDGIGRPGTKRNGERLDWIFIRGPVVCSGTRVHRDVRASDHYPLSTNLTLTV